MREIHPNELAARADHFMHEFERAAAYSNGTLAPQSLYDLVASRAAALFEFSNGIAVIDSVPSESGLLVRIAAITGADMQEWIGEVDQVAVAIAKKLKARGVISVGRPGWKKEAVKHGYSITHIVGFKEINHA